MYLRSVWGLTVFVLLGSTPVLALPHYYSNLTGSGSGLGTMILNQSGTGAAIDVIGTYFGGGSISPFITVSGGLVFKDPSFSFPDFDYNGTVYFAQPCCSGFSVDNLSSLTGKWTYDPVASGAQSGESSIDYSFVPPPPTDVPEPSTIGLSVLGTVIIAATGLRIRKSA